MPPIGCVSVETKLDCSQCTTTTAASRTGTVVRAETAQPVQPQGSAREQPDAADNRSRGHRNGDHKGEPHHVRELVGGHQLADAVGYSAANKSGLSRRARPPVTFDANDTTERVR